ncbi:class I SAM-dependent methyltransferase|uniref:Methyltransferase domain-containing protein n=1 Tax=Dendrosporobacter quercicolus TaxID=146817 RepID=A0A1H0A566_9FIRM|nr:class I SAM-dependent methyltransferase [Dendrosporobacter quercicolus]NSL50009.1 class I SAM-dependent methyltransferase [Dendrosporobacter quercicolus DSM 1736]SDN28587.1 Methyltransferase domain-containing protein [Dendrosporobacter quercicolus]
MSDKIITAYRKSKSIYDDVLTQRTWWSRLYSHLFWGGTDDRDIAARLLAYIPADFSGSLLDVPAGTAALTWEKYKALPAASITCLDYSEDMLEQAKKRLGHVANIAFLQGDVGHMPFKDEAFDTVLSMNGFHAFPDKDQAFLETYRVLKKGGSFLACCYICGQSKATDFLVTSFLAKKGWFTPPFETAESLNSRLNGLYQTVNLHLDGAMVWFTCVK